MPDKILWRQKDAFSDAVGYSWVDVVKKQARLIMTDDMVREEIESAGGYNTPLSVEEAMYRGAFRELYSNPTLISEIWRPKWTGEIDPSATKLNVFKN